MISNMRFLNRDLFIIPLYIEILNYAKEVKRNDVKKSEVILSNYIQGTAPRYEYIQALEDSLCVD